MLWCGLFEHYSVERVTNTAIRNSKSSCEFWSRTVSETTRWYKDYDQMCRKGTNDLSVRIWKGSYCVHCWYSEWISFRFFVCFWKVLLFINWLLLHRSTSFLVGIELLINLIADRQDMFVVIKICLLTDFVIVQGKQCIEVSRKFRKERFFFFTFIFCTCGQSLWRSASPTFGSDFGHMFRCEINCRVTFFERVRFYNRFQRFFLQY